MANLRQRVRQKMRAVWVSTSGTTAKRDTEYNDLGYNDYAWKLSEAYLCGCWIKPRTDVIL